MNFLGVMTSTATCVPSGFHEMLSLLYVPQVPLKERARIHRLVGFAHRQGGPYSRQLALLASDQINTTECEPTPRSATSGTVNPTYIVKLADIDRHRGLRSFDVSSNVVTLLAVILDRAGHRAELIATAIQFSLGRRVGDTAQSAAVGREAIDIRIEGRVG